MRVHCACERTESRESNKIEFVFTHFIVCTIIFFSVKTPCRITRKKTTRRERVCLLSLSCIFFNLFRQSIGILFRFLLENTCREKNTRSKKINRFHRENLETLLYSKFDIFCLNKHFLNNCIFYITFVHYRQNPAALPFFCYSIVNVLKEYLDKACGLYFYS